MVVSAHELARASVRRPLYKSLLLGTALTALVAAPALANPMGGQVSTGTASISSSRGNTSVKQTSEGVVINWSSFNIGAGQTTQFYQPNSKAIAVNRIGSASASQILGTLDANGNVVLINGNGLLFGKNARVNVGSLVATSTDGTDSDVLAGKFATAGNQNARVVNHGVITVGTGGTVALVAPNVTNTGIVNAKLGTVSLGAANKFTVDLNGDGLVSFAATGDVNGNATVTNKGRLVGANISMTAHAAEGVATGVVNTSGVIVAQGAHQVSGTIVLDAGDGGTIDIAKGRLEAKGSNGGGSITVGSWADAGVTVNSGAVLNASATKTGGGGQIHVISSTTNFAGTALAQGGAISGNGGLIETSGELLGFDGSNISASAVHGSSGTWLLDPAEFITYGPPPPPPGGTLEVGPDAAAHIDSILDGGTNVEIETTGNSCQGYGRCVANGQNNIDILAALAWDTTSTLTIDSWFDLNILAPIDVNGGGTLALSYNGLGSSAEHGVLSFGLTSTGFTGSVNFAVGAGEGIAGQTLTINGNPYTLLYSMTDVQNINNNLAGGYYALATSLDASSVSGWAPIGTDGAGNVLNSGNGLELATFEGLGNTISNLTVNVNSATSAGLFGYGYETTIRDFGVVGGSVSASGYAGGLAGEWVNGTVVNSFSTASVTGNSSGNLGGLVGYLDLGSISNSFASGAVTATVTAGNVGGLVGTDDNGVISNSHAIGNVTADATGGGDFGGLLGFNAGGTISNSYATGTVSALDNGYVGGLVGFNTSSGTITNDYATGAVNSFEGTFVGGLVGENVSGTITESYATGAVYGLDDVGGLAGANSGAISTSYATGNVYGEIAYTGGLVGQNFSSITDSYAMGTVDAPGTFDVGGLVGENTSGSTIATSFSTGDVFAPGGTNVGGFVGQDDTPGNITNSYWDMYTSGMGPSEGAGSVSNDSGITGMSTHNLMGALPSGFSGATWSVAGSLYPYLSWQFSGTPEVISGAVLNGTTRTAGDNVGLVLDGSIVNTPVSMASGADGFYYVLVAPGTIPATGTSLLAYITTPGSSGNTFEEKVTGSDAQGVILHLNDLTINATAYDSEKLEKDLNDTIGDLTGSQFLYLNGIDGFQDEAATTVLRTSTDDFSFDNVFNATSGTLELKAGLNDKFSENGGDIQAEGLTILSYGNTVLDGSNQIRDLVGTSQIFGNFSLTDFGNLVVSGTIEGNAGENITLTTTNSGYLHLDGFLDAGTGTVTLDIGGSITENASTGSIEANLLQGSFGAGAALDGANAIDDLGNITNTGVGGFAFTNDKALRTTGIVNAGKGDLSLTTSGGNINIDGTLQAAAGLVDIDSAGVVSENKTTGAIDAAGLEGSSTGASLLGSNSIGDIDGFDSNGGDFKLSDGETLTTLDTISATGAVVSLTTTTGDIDIDGTITGHTLDLNAAGAADENANGAIEVNRLNVTAQTGIDLDSDLNDIANVGTDSTTSGPNTIDKS